VEPTRGNRPVTRLGLWLTGPWLSAGGIGTGDGPLIADGDFAAHGSDPSPRSDPDGSSVLDRIVARAGLAEESGFDSLWVTDRVPPVQPGSSAPADPEAYSLLGALAARTHTVRLGAIPVGVDRRPPALVAKIVTGIDVISHGRGVLTYGLGPPDAERAARVTEVLRVGRALLEDESPTFEGNFYSVVQAMNRPGPVQDGGIPVVVFIERHSYLATVAMTAFAGLADAVIVGGGPEDVRRVVDEVRGMPRRRDGVNGEEVGPLRVIGIGPAPGPPASPLAGQRPDEGPTVHRVAVAVRELFDAGVDGCVVPMELTTPPEVVAAISAEIGVVPMHHMNTGGRPGDHH
jgi:hypothetical protein